MLLYHGFRIFLSSYYIVLDFLFFPLLSNTIHSLFSLKRQLTCAIRHRSKAMLWREKQHLPPDLNLCTLLTGLDLSAAALFANYFCALEMLSRLQLHSNTCHLRKQPPTIEGWFKSYWHYSLFIHPFLKSLFHSELGIWSLWFRQSC